MMNGCAILFVAMGFLALGQPVMGQDSSRGEKKPMFRTLGLGFSTLDLFYALDDKDVPLPVTEDSRSEFLILPSDKKIQFYRIESLADGTSKRIPVGAVEVNRGGKLPLLLFSRGQSGPRVEILDDSLEAFPAGNFRILNRLGEEIGAIFGKSPLAVPANADRMIDGARGRNGNTVFVQLYLIARNPRQLVFSNNWAFNPMVRSLVVVVPPSPPSQTPIVRRIVEAVDMLTPPESGANPANP